MDRIQLSDHTVCLVEDDWDYANSLSDYLRLQGFAPVVITSFDEFVDYLDATAPACCIVDQFVRQRDVGASIPMLRRLYNGPLLMLTGNSDANDRILCLESGADDFILKSATPREILARIRATLRRVPIHFPIMDTASPAQSQTVAADGWILDYDTRVLTSRSQHKTILTRSERGMLWLLMSNRRALVTRPTVYREVLHRSEESEGRSIDNLIVRIRRAVRSLQGEIVLEPCRGSGYIFYGFSGG